MNIPSIGGQLRLRHNVHYVLTDKFGKIKPLFQENRLFRWLLKHGLVSPATPKIPYVFGYWADARTISNLVVSAGKAGVASRINGSGGEAAFTYVGVGTGTTAAAAGNTALEAEKSEAGASSTTHKAATASRITTTVTNDTAQLVVSFVFTATLALTESGVFNASADGTMLARQVFSAVNVVDGDTLQLTWRVSVA